MKEKVENQRYDKFFFWQRQGNDCSYAVATAPFSEASGYLGPHGRRICSSAFVLLPGVSQSFCQIEKEL